MKKIRAISILLSGKCNLNCEYCFLHKNLSFLNLHEIVKKSYENKEYLNTIEKVLNALDTKTSEITHITLWGGEPLLDLSYFNQNISELFEMFPNVQTFWTSTNFNININDLFILFQQIDLFAKQKIKFDLQISMDGIFNKNGHNLPLQMYKKNLEQLFQKLNLLKLNKLIITINFRTTVPEDLFLKEFDDENNIRNYIETQLQFIDFVEQLIINKNINLNRTITPVPSYPTHETSLQGIQLAKITRMWDIIKQDYNIEEPLFASVLHLMNNHNLFSSNYECGNLVSNLTILPDGSIANCINGYISVFPEYEKILIQNNDTQGLKELETEKSFFFNPLKMTKKELKQHLYYINYGVKNNISTRRYLAFNLCKELVEAGQISSIYKDNDILLKHLQFLEGISGCMFYNLHESSLPYSCTPSFYRKYFNGIVEQVYNQYTINRKI